MRDNPSETAKGAWEGIKQGAKDTLYGRDRNFTSDLAVGMTPAGVVHDVLDIGYGVNDIKNRNYLSGGLNTLAGGIGFIPLAGDIVKVPLKKLGKEFIKEGVQQLTQEGIQQVAQEGIQQVTQEGTQKLTGTAVDVVKKGDVPSAKRGPKLDPEAPHNKKIREEA